jgi:hypothetical protein
VAAVTTPPAEEASGAEVEDGHQRSSDLLATGVVVSAYVVLSVLLFRSILGHFSTRLIGGPDGSLIAWWIKEGPFALFRGHDPFTTPYLLFPRGSNAMWNVSMFLPAMVLSPLTFTVGPIASVNLLFIASPVLSAAAAYWMCRRFGCARPASALAGLLYGFGPYVVGQSYGHPQMSLAWFPPVAAVILRRVLVTQTGTPRSIGVVLGLTAFAQLLCSEELLASVAVVAAASVVVLALLYRDAVRSRLPFAMQSLGWAALCGAVLSAWPLAVQLFGPNRPRTPVQPAGLYVADLTAFFAPNGLMRFDPFGLRHLTAHAPGNIVEAGGYLGIPLLLLIGGLVYVGRRDRLVGFAAIMVAVAAVFSLGGRLHVAGHDTHIPMPWLPFEHLPLTNGILPARLALYVLMFSGLVIARSLTGRTLGRPALGGLAVVVLACAAVLWPNPPTRSTARPTSPAFFAGSAVRMIPVSDPVLLAPISDTRNTDAMLWQATADFRFPMLGGYALPWNQDDPTDPASTALLAIETGHPVPLADTPAAIGADVRSLGLAAVILGPTFRHVATAESLFTAAIGQPPQETGGVTLWLLR